MTKGKRKHNRTVPPLQPPRIIQLVCSQWDSRNDKLNSTLYGLLSDGRVLMYVPAANPKDAGWKCLNMHPAAPPRHQPTEYDEVDDYLHEW
jgi:hypothetical protein